MTTESPVRREFRSGDYVAGQSGWRLSADGLEVNNIEIGDGLADVPAGDKEGGDQ